MSDLDWMNDIEADLSSSSLNSDSDPFSSDDDLLLPDEPVTSPSSTKYVAGLYSFPRP